MPLKKTYSDFAAEARGVVHEIDCDQLAEDFPDAVVLDVRESEERAQGFIPESILIPRGILEKEIEKRAFGGVAKESDLDRPIVCYCRSGNRSAMAGLALIQMGFREVMSLAGGIEAWRRGGRPIESSGS